MTDEIKKVETKIDIEKDGVFVTENNVFDISIKYYNQDGKMFIKNVDDDFDDAIENFKTINMTFKYPSQGDCMAIERVLPSSDNASDNLKTFLRMEYSRLVILIRKWSLSDKIEESQILQLHPKIVKSVFFEIRNKIGLDGLL